MGGRGLPTPGPPHACFRTGPCLHSLPRARRSSRHGASSRQCRLREGGGLTHAVGSAGVGEEGRGVSGFGDRLLKLLGTVLRDLKQSRCGRNCNEHCFSYSEQHLRGITWLRGRWETQTKVRTGLAGLTLPGQRGWLTAPGVDEIPREAEPWS